KSETALQTLCLKTLFKKANLSPKNVDYLFAGDLESQCTASAYCMRGFPLQFLGLYGACSTMALSLGLASTFVASGICKTAVAMTSSHFCTAERQFRTPLDYGGKRTPTAQWTVTGAGSVLIGEKAKPPFIKAVTFGKVIDYEVTDINNMGAAMAPAVADTLLHYFADTGNKPSSFDCIYTGDLGEIGSDLLHKMMANEGVPLPNHKDCGMLIYDLGGQDVGVGGSGCGCGASVLCGHILNLLQKEKQTRILFIATGALMSPITSMQGESIPSIAHLIEISNDG
ncbi:MAG: stage V sporulation protein AD, partial [Oscillospiraceae bacterium]